MLPRKTLTNIYKAFIRPHLNYVDYIYDDPCKGGFRLSNFHKSYFTFYVTKDFDQTLLSLIFVSHNIFKFWRSFLNQNKIR